MYILLSPVGITVIAVRLFCGRAVFARTLLIPTYQGNILCGSRMPGGGGGGGGIRISEEIRGSKSTYPRSSGRISP